MKKLLVALVLAASVALPLSATAAGDGPIKVVYHVNENNAQALNALRNIRNHLTADPSAKIVVVTHAGGIQFLLDGAPFQILSGEMHYPRVPREYWRDRFRKARAMGLNTISTYVFWNLHEPSPGRYDFSGNLDVAEFIREAGAETLLARLKALEAKYGGRFTPRAGWDSPLLRADATTNA